MIRHRSKYNDILMFIYVHNSIVLGDNTWLNVDLSIYKYFQLKKYLANVVLEQEEYYFAMEQTLIQILVM